MKDQYVGDIGDLYKFGLLRFIFNGSAHQLGVNWYLTDPDDRTDGNITEFGKDRSACDPDLSTSLRDIRHQKRSVLLIERKGVLPNGTAFYGDTIPNGSEARDQWHQEALAVLKNCPFVFLDPDNGIQTLKVVYGRSRGLKYAFIKEIKDYWNQGKTIIVYNHRSRQSPEEYQERFLAVKSELGCSMTGVSAKTSPIRDFIFFVRPSHRKFIDDSIRRILTDECWSQQLKSIS